MKQKIYLFLPFVLLMITDINCQENVFSHYFSGAVYNNPAFSGNCRFSQIQTVNRIQPTTSNAEILNYSLSYDLKMLNQHSGFNISLDQRKAKFKETNIKLNYSYTIVLSPKLVLKSGLGLSFNTINTYGNSYKYPDQYNDYGFTGLPSAEDMNIERFGYPGMSTGIVLYDKLWWFSAAVDNINLSKHTFINEESHVPAIIALTGGYFFAIDKDKKAKRYFDRDGGLNPYSSIGPILSFYKHGFFNITSFGINAFTKPVFWGLSYRYNSFQKNFFKNGAGSVNILAGYRNESVSVAYSYDFITTRTPTNLKGAHEISFIFYFFSIKEDYKKNPLIPFPNQLMY